MEYKITYRNMGKPESSPIMPGGEENIAHNVKLLKIQGATNIKVRRCVKMYTKGTWVKQGSFIFSSESPPRLVAEVMRSNMRLTEQQANALLIVAAVNACQSMNEENPLVVAQNIKGMYDKLQKISRWMDMLIKDAKAQLKTSGNFTTLMEALEHDIKNYEATKADITSVLTLIEKKE